MSDKELVNGGYYKESIRSKVGTGDTAKDSNMENIWVAQLNPNGEVFMTLLDNHDQPTAYREKIDHEEIGGRFVHDPAYKPRKVDHKAAQADKIAARAERHLEKEEYLSAEFEFGKAIQVDKRNVRANFGLGKTYLASGDVDKAKETFKNLVDIDEVAEAENKHIFNELGITLRKQGMFAEAVKHYKRALDLSKGDENLWFNLGRAMYEGGLFDQAVEVLKKALTLNPNMDEAKAFLHAASKRGRD